eukprot:6142942-Prymnesium_polylepis.1
MWQKGPDPAEAQPAHQTPATTAHAPDAPRQTRPDDGFVFVPARLDVSPQQVRDHVIADSGGNPGDEQGGEPSVDREDSFIHISEADLIVPEGGVLDEGEGEQGRDNNHHDEE